MALGFVNNRSNIKTSAIQSWYVRALGGSTTLKYSFIADNSLDTITVAGAVFANGNTVQFRNGSGTIPSGLSEGVTYFVISTAGNAFQVSLTQGGAAVPLVSDGAEAGGRSIFFADSGHYQLPNLYEGKVNVKSLSQRNNLGQNIVYGADFVATAKIFSTGKTNVLKVLDKLSSNEIVHVVNTSSGSFHPGGLTEKKFGTKWKFVCDSDSDKNRYIELTCNRKVAKSEVTELLTTAAPSYGTADADDILYPMNSISRSDIIPAGFSKFEVCDTYSGTFLDIGEIMNGKMTVELLTQMNSLGCDIGYALKIDVSVEAMQSSATELALLENLSNSTMFYKITLLDGTVFTLAAAGGQQLGIDWEYHCEKDSDGVSFISYNGTGVVQSTVLDAIFV